MIGGGTTSDNAAALPNVRGFVLLFRSLRLVLGPAVSLSLFSRAVIVERWHRLPASTISAIHRLCDGHVDMRVLKYFINACVDRIRTALDAVAEGASESKSGGGMDSRASPNVLVRRLSMFSDAGSLASSTIAAMPIGEGSSLFVRLRAYIDMLASLCVASVTHNPEAALDVPFVWHVNNHRPCQFMPQQYRLASWLSSWFAPHMLNASVSHKQVIPAPGFNVHSPQLLAYFSDQAMASHHVATGTVGFLAPRFSRVVPWDAFLCAQAALGRELPWGELESDPAFPASFDILVRLLRVHPQPLKLLCVVAPSRLFELINTVETSSAETGSDVAEVLHKLGDHVLDRDTLAITDERVHTDDERAGAEAGQDTTRVSEADMRKGGGGGGMSQFAVQSALNHHVSVLKWCLLQTSWGTSRFVFTGDDLRRLIDLKIPLAVAPSQVRWPCVAGAL